MVDYSLLLLDAVLYIFLIFIVDFSNIILNNPFSFINSQNLIHIDLNSAICTFHLLLILFFWLSLILHSAPHFECACSLELPLDF